VKRPFTSAHSMLLGTLYGILPIVNFLVLGYVLECASTAAKKHEELPKWEQYGRLFRRGFGALVIKFIWNIPTIIAAGIAGYNDDYFAVGIIAAGIFATIASYISSASLVRYAVEDEFSKAFTLSVLFSKIFQGKWLLAWLVVLLYTILLLIPTTLLSIVTLPTLVGPTLIGSVFTYVWLVMSMTIYGEAYA